MTKITDRIPAKRLGLPAEVADLAYFLLSDKAVILPDNRFILMVVYCHLIKFKSDSGILCLYSNHLKKIKWIYPRFCASLTIGSVITTVE